MPYFAPTQSLGIAAFGLAAILAWAAARASKREAAPWRILALVNGALAVEIALRPRFALARGVVRAFIGFADHGARRGPQLLVAGVLLLAGLAVAWLLFARLRKRGAGIRPAALLGTLAVALFAVEAVSLHQVDALLFRHLGPLPLFAWGWALCGFGAAACAFASIGRR